MSEASSSSAELARALRRAGLGDVATDAATRAAYSSDASLYRVLPRAVVRPHDAGELIGTLEVARSLGVPLTMRGAGTSVAGNAIGPGIVVDTSAHLNRVLEIDPIARSARVQPGVVQAVLQRAAAPHGLRFGPDPSTHTRCTIGGMIGNDACGSRALGYGRTADNVLALQAVTGTGAALSLARPGRFPDGATLDRPTVAGAAAQVTALREIVAGALAPLRTELGRFDRQISGYALHNLLPEKGFDLAGALVGSEGTLAVVTEATVRLVADPAHRVMVALGFTDFAEAGAAAPSVLPFGPTACEGLDSRIVDVVRERRGPGAVPDLPKGTAWLFVEIAGDDAGEVLARAQALAASADWLDARVVIDPAEAGTLWKIREDGGGLAGRAPSGRPAWPGWEDSAVPPAELGAYLRAFDELLTEHDLTAMPFGHFGDGCLHVRVDVDLGDARGPARFREFLTAAADLVAAHGGSLTGEHGDGRARSELLPKIYSPAMLEVFAAVKAVLDPQNLLNPGVLVDPAPIDADLRRPAARLPRSTLAFGYPHDGGNLIEAVHRCTGVAKCRSVAQGSGVVMCPSYAATGSELHSTRGRARVLQEMMNGELLSDGWRSPEVHEALDLCLSCKGCASDCPTGIDMATYKAEATYQRYRRRLRPRSHYTIGWLPRWSKLAKRMPRLANAATGLPLMRRPALWLAGVDGRRSVPRFAEHTARQQIPAQTSVQSPDRRSHGQPVLVFVDSFTEHFAPEVAQAVVAVLERAGYAPQLTGEEVCCGLTWISTGQLDAARRRLQRTVAALEPVVAQGIPVVGIEPSCTAALRHDAVDMLGTEAARRVAGGVRTLAELLLRTPGWRPPDLSGVEVVAQPHCHHHAVMGWATDRTLLERAGARVTELGGCCGLAGNFGVEIGHYEVSVAVAEQQLLPALDEHPAAVYLADGFSCRTQAADLRGRPGTHLAQLLSLTGPAGSPR